MSQQVEPNPYPPRAEIINFFAKFLLSASFVLAFLFVFTNAIFVDGYYGQLSAYLPETLVYYLIVIIIVAVVTYVGPNVVETNSGKDKKTVMLDIFTYFGFIAFFLLALFQFQFQASNYPVMQDPYKLTGFAWQFVLLWWLVSFSLITWAIILYVMKIKIKGRK